MWGPGAPHNELAERPTQEGCDRAKARAVLPAGPQQQEPLTMVAA